MPFNGVVYHHVLHQVCRHDNFGGVTQSCWRITFATREQEPIYDLSLRRMTGNLYPRHLQTVLDDTIGPELTWGHLEMKKRPDQRKANAEPVAMVNKTQPVFDSAGLGPDLAAMTSRERDTLWILAVSVFSKTQVLRKPSKLELLAIRDYAGKIWYNGMTDYEINSILLARLALPPGKMLKTFAFGICQQVFDLNMTTLYNDVVPDHISPASIWSSKGSNEPRLRWRMMQALALAIGHFRMRHQLKLYCLRAPALLCTLLVGNESVTRSLYMPCQE